MVLTSKKRRKRKKPQIKRCVPAKSKKKPKARRSDVDAQAAAKRLKKTKRRKCRPVKKKKPAKKPESQPPGMTTPAAQPPVIGAPAVTGPVPPVPAPPAPPTTPPPYALPVYKGTFGREQAARLLFRAGSGPRRGEAETLAAKGLEAAVLSLTRPVGPPVLEGPAPTDRYGNPWDIDPVNVYEMDALYWFDRMLRSNQPLVERLALVFHDWFATHENGISQLRMLNQTNLFRQHCLGSFKDLVHDIGADPAMILYLNLDRSLGGRPNENYARELMELFTLGVGRGYTEQDIREAARALTGWTHTADDSAYYIHPGRRDTGVKTVFGTTGDLDWEDIARLVIEHPSHPAFFVTKLWGYFIGDPPSPAETAALSKLYKESGYTIRPVLEAILMHPALYTGSPMVKPPVVFILGMLRARGKFINGDLYTRSAELAGQRLYQPPDVGGWDDTRWLDSNTMAARWLTVYQLLANYAIPSGDGYPSSETAEAAVESALAFWDRPQLRTVTIKALLDFARTAAPSTPNAAARAQRQNALRHLIAVSPDSQVA